MPDLIAVCVPLDAGGVEEAGVVADQAAAREDPAGQALDVAGGDGARAVGQALAAFDVLADLGVGLPALHLLEGRQVRVLVVEADHEAERDQVVLEVVEKTAAMVRLSIGQPAVYTTRPWRCCSGFTSHSSLMPMP